MEIKILSENDIPALIKLYEIGFQKKTTAEFWRWKHFENPFGESITLGGFEGNRLIASISLLKTNFSFKKKIMRSFQATDIMIDNNFQGKGLARELLKAQEELLINYDKLIDFAYYFPVSWTTRLYLDYNCNFINKVNLFIKPRMLSKLSKIGKKKVDWEIESVNSISSKAVLGSIHSEELKIQYSEDFISWKLSNPKYNYKLIAVKDGSSEAHIIVNELPSGLIYVVDFLGIQNGIQACLSVLDDYASKSNKKGIMMMTAFGNSLSKKLLMNGYLANPTKYGPLSSTLDFLVYSKNKENVELFNKNRWSLTPIIYDDI